MQYKLSITHEELLLEVLIPRDQSLPVLTLHIEDIVLGILQPSSVPYISKFRHWLKLSKLSFATIKNLFPIFKNKSLTKQQFYVQIDPKLRAYVHTTNSLYILADGKKLTANSNTINTSNSKFQLPLKNLKTNLDTFLELDIQGKLMSIDLPVIASGFSIQIIKNKKGILKFIFSGSFANQPQLLHQNVEIFLDSLQIGIASVQRQQGNHETLQFIFFLNAGLAEEIINFYYLRIKILDTFYHIPDSLFNKKLTSINTENEITPRALKLLDNNFLLNKKGRLVKTKENDINWLKDTLALYHHANKIFEEQFQYELYITGGTLLGYARSGGIIGFDKDFDSGYVSKFSNPKDIKGEFKHIILTLLKSGEDIRLVTRVGKKFRCDYFMWFDSTGKHIDVFPAAFINGLYRRPTFVNTTLLESDIYPLKQALFDGYEVKVPNNFEKKVAAVYGDSWHSPDPFWKKVKTPEIIEYRKLIMLTKADFLDIAEYSQHEGDFIRESIANNRFKIQF